MTQQRKQYLIWFKWTIVLGILFYSTYCEIYRIIHWDITYDEAMSYFKFVKPFFMTQHSFFQKADLFREHLHSTAAANNHLLNTFFMGMIVRYVWPVFGNGSEAILRLPTIGAFLLHAGTVITLYAKKRLHLVGVVLLFSVRFYTEFFALCRGYGYAASWVLLSLYFLSEWETHKEKDKAILYCLLCMTIAICFQTSSLLVAAPLYLWILFRMLKRSIFREYLKPKKLIPILAMAAINIMMVYFHLMVYHSDEAFLNHSSEGYTSVLLNYSGSWIHGCSYRYAALFLLFLLLGWTAYASHKVQTAEMGHIAMITLYLLVLSILANTMLRGERIERLLLPSYPLLVWACQDGSDFFLRLLPHKYSWIPLTLCLYCAACHPDVERALNNSFIWPTDQGTKEVCYELYENNETMTFKEKLDGHPFNYLYYREQILERTGYDIFDRTYIQ